MSYLQALTDPRNQTVRAWWSAQRYAAVYAMARAALALQGVTALQAQKRAAFAAAQRSPDAIARDWQRQLTQEAMA